MKMEQATGLSVPKVIAIMMISGATGPDASSNGPRTRLHGDYKEFGCEEK